MLDRPISCSVIYWQLPNQFPYLLQPFSCILPTCWKWYGSLKSMSQCGSGVISQARWLMLPSCCLGNLHRAPPVAVDKVPAAADMLLAYFTGYFVFACHIAETTESSQATDEDIEWRLESPALKVVKVMPRQTDGDEIARFSWQVGCAIFDALFLLFLNANINRLPGSAANGCSSCNNIALTESWRVYDLVPAMKRGWWLSSVLHRQSLTVIGKLKLLKRFSHKMAQINLRTRNSPFFNVSDKSLYRRARFGYGATYFTYFINPCGVTRPLREQEKKDLRNWWQNTVAVPEILQRMKSILQIYGGNIWEVLHFPQPTSLN